MSHAVSALPPRYHAAIPYLNVTGGLDAIGFYADAFDAICDAKILRGDGKLAHAEIRIGQALVMLREEIPEMQLLAPQSIGGSGFNLLVYVEDVDAFVARAEAAGAHVVQPPAEHFHGDRVAVLRDPSGHTWFFATHLEDLDARQLDRRAREWNI